MAMLTIDQINAIVQPLEHLARLREGDSPELRQAAEEGRLAAREHYRSAMKAVRWLEFALNPNLFALDDPRRGVKQFGWPMIGPGVTLEDYEPIKWLLDLSATILRRWGLEETSEGDRAIDDDAGPLCFLTDADHAEAMRSLQEFREAREEVAERAKHEPVLSIEELRSRFICESRCSDDPI